MHILKIFFCWKSFQGWTFVLRFQYLSTFLILLFSSAKCDVCVDDGFFLDMVMYWMIDVTDLNCNALLGRYLFIVSRLGYRKSSLLQ